MKYLYDMPEAIPNHQKTSFSPLREWFRSSSTCCITRCLSQMDSVPSDHGHQPIQKFRSSRQGDTENEVSPTACESHDSALQFLWYPGRTGLPHTIPRPGLETRLGTKGFYRGVLA